MGHQKKDRNGQSSRRASEEKEGRNSVRAGGREKGLARVSPAACGKENGRALRACMLHASREKRRKQQPRASWALGLVASLVARLRGQAWLLGLAAVLGPLGFLLGLRKKQKKQHIDK